MTARGRGAIKHLWGVDPAPVIEARRRALARIDMSRDPLPPRCRMYVHAALVDLLCDKPAVLGLKRPDDLNILYVCADHVRLGELSMI